MRRRSIRAKLALATILSGIFFVAIVGAVVFGYLNNALTAERINNFENIAIEQGHETRGNFGQYQLFVKMLATRKDISNYLQEQSESGRGEVDRIFNEYARADADILSIYLMDKNGDTLISTDKTFVGKNYGFREYFKNALSGRPYTGAVWGKTSNQFGYYFSYPIFSSAGTAIGVLAVKVNEGYFARPILDSKFSDNPLMLVDDVGVIMISREPNRFLHSLGKLSNSALDRIAKENRFLGKEIKPLGYSAVQDAVVNFTGPKLIDFIDQTDHKKEVVGVQKLPDLPFFMVFEIGLENIQQEAFDIVLAMSAVMLAVVILIVFFMNWLTTKFLTNPIAEIADAIQKISGGNFSHRLTKIRGNNEVSDLANAINQMSERLGNYYRDLDNIVNVKTTELQDTNKNLTKQQQTISSILARVAEEKEKLAIEKAQDEAILAGIGDGVFVLDINKKIILFNPIAERISGFSAKEAIGQKYNKILKFVSEKDGQLKDGFIAEAIEGGRPALMFSNTVLIRKDGSRVPVADSAAPIVDSQGKISGCVVVFRDVAKEREVDRIKTEFVSVASHQLRTPLTGIKWFSELLSKCSLSPEVKDYIEQINISNERMIRLVDDLLSVSRIETGKKFDIILKNTDIFSIVKNVITEQTPNAINKNITLVCAQDAPRKMILNVDELKIRQVFENLISNAVKYSRENSQVIVGCDHNSKEAVFYVRDSGVGIPLRQQHQVFSKFFRADNVSTLHTDGTGLGLYIAKAIVEAHGGRIWFDSKENQGSTFYVALPIKLG